MVPRTTADISLGGATKSPLPSAAAANGTNLPAAGGSGTLAGGPLTTGSSTTEGARQPSSIALADLASHEGELVIVGGRIEAIDGSRLLVNDGSSVAAIRLPTTAGTAPLSVGALVNARGTVTRTEQGGLEVVVDDANNIRTLDLALAAQEAPAPTAGDALGATAGVPNIDSGSTSGPGGLLMPALLTLAILAGVVGSIAVAVARRPQLLVAARLALARLRVRE